jgi:hypothetical protein
MQKLQLYISGTRVDLFKDESVSMTQSIQNVKDLSKIFTEFTQSFTIPASKTNNILFKHYYNFDITGGFDARNKVAGEIQLNDIPFKTGYVKLEGVEMKKNKAYAYKVTFFGDTVNLKDLLSDDQLSSLSSLNTYNLTYNYTNIASKLTNTSGTDPIICPLITHTRQLYYNTSTTGEGNLHKPSSGYLTSANGVYWSDLKYALRLSEIIDAIESKYSITFSSDFFNDSTNNPFYNLYMWLHRKKGDVEPATQVTETYQQVSSFTAYSTPSPETSMVTGALIIPSSLVTSPNFLNGNDLSFIPNSSYASTPYNIRIFRNGSLFYQGTNLTGTTLLTSTQLGFLGAGNYTVSVSSATSATSFFDAGDIRWALTGQKGEAVSTWSDEWRSSSAQATSADFEFVITEQIPKMKIIDFLTGIFKTFNLTAYVDVTGTIVVRTLDSYYAASSVVWDLNDYVDVSKGTVDVALPFKEIEFSFQGLGTFLAKQYEQLENSGWGSLSYTLDDATYDAPEQTYKVQVPYEHLQYERLYSQAGAITDVQWGWSVDDNKDSYIGQPLIFYPIRKTSGTDILLKQAATTNADIDDYWMPSNSQSLDASTSTQNINFQLEVNEYTEDTTFTGTLFENYYKTYIQDVFNNKRRLTKVKAYLPLKMIYNLKLNDKISLNGYTYKINSITTNLTTGESSLELLNTV